MRIRAILCASYGIGSLALRTRVGRVERDVRHALPMLEANKIEPIDNKAIASMKFGVPPRVTDLFCFLFIFFAPVKCGV